MEHDYFTELVKELHQFANGEIPISELDRITYLRYLEKGEIEKFNTDEKTKHIFEIISDCVNKDRFEWLYDINYFWMYSELLDNDFDVPEDFFCDFPFEKAKHYSSITNLSLYTQIACTNDNLPIEFIDQYENLKSKDVTQKFYWDLVQSEVSKEIYMSYVNRYDFDIRFFLEKNKQYSLKKCETVEEILHTIKKLPFFRTILYTSFNPTIKMEDLDDLLEFILNEEYQIRIDLWSIFDLGVLNHLSISEKIKWKNSIKDIKMYRINLIYLFNALKTSDEAAIELFEEEFFELVSKILNFDLDVFLNDSNIPTIKAKFKISATILLKYHEKFDEYDKIMRHLIYVNLNNLILFKPDVTEIDIRNIIFKE